MAGTSAEVGTESTVAGPGVTLAQGRRRLMVFLLTMLGLGAVVFGVGWFTQLREVMHGALIGVAVFALLPFAIIALGVLISIAVLACLVVVALVTSFGDGGGDVPADLAVDAGQPVAELGVRIMPGYYRWLARQRHPVFWGVPCGVLMGGLSLWLMLSTLVLPGETRSVESLTTVRQKIEAYYAEHKRYPKPDEAGHLPYAALGETRPGVLTDGFGRPLEYQVEGKWRVAAYRVRSDGYDGKPGGKDDLCVSGVTRLARWSALLGKGEAGKGKVSGVKAKLGAIRELRCEGE